MDDPPITPIRERIVGTDYLVMAFNPTLGIGRSRKRVVDLACGHKALTSAIEHTTCVRCTEMLRRSVTDGSEDYDAYRRGVRQDRMVWSEDPCQQLNEGHLP